MLDRDRFALRVKACCVGSSAMLMSRVSGSGSAPPKNRWRRRPPPIRLPPIQSLQPLAKCRRQTRHLPSTVEPVSPEEYKKYIASQRGKVVFVDFWATYCLPCREKFPHTLALAKKYANRGLSVVSMSMDSPDASFQKQIVSFLTNQNAQIKNFANRLEDTDAAFSALDIVGGALPHYKIYGRDGKLRKKFGGDPDHPYSDADIEQALVTALHEGTP